MKLFSILFLLVWAFPVFAQNLGGWSDTPQSVRDWLSRQKNPQGISCCGIGESLNVQIIGTKDNWTVLRVTNPRGTNFKVGDTLYADSGIQVPENYDPNGEPVAWVSPGGYVFCLSVLEGI